MITHLLAKGFVEGEIQLYCRFKLLAFVLPKVDSEVEQVRAEGWTYAPFSHHGRKKPTRRTTVQEEDEVLRYQMHRRIIEEF